MTPYPLPVTRSNGDRLANEENQWEYVLNVVNVGGITKMRIQGKFFLKCLSEFRYKNFRYDAEEDLWQNDRWNPSMLLLL